MNIIEQIKAEIEDWLREYTEDSQFELGERYGYKRLLSFLDTLESEKPMDQEGLDEEIHRFFEECIEVHEVPLYGKVKEDVIPVDCYEITAFHFAKWGAEHAKKQMINEAVKGEVRKVGTIGYFEFSNEQQFHSLLEQFQDCDKVRIIIVKDK